MATQKLFTSAELMTNYMQAETLAPDKKFEALQTAGGRSLLFSIGTDQRFYLTEEVTGEGTGWHRWDLTAALAGFFAGSAPSAKTFAVDQHGDTNRFTIALAVTVDAADHLFVASDYTTDDNGRINGLDWQARPFAPTDQPAGPPEIAQVYVQQTAAEPFIVVNTVPPGKSTFERYYIDSSGGGSASDSASTWKRYNLPINMDAADALLCGGRRTGESIDGSYSLGTVGSAPALFYQQLYNPFNPSAPGATAQLITGDERPAALASTPAADAQAADARTTDLYVATETGSLYLFTADNQHSNAQGLKLMNHDLFQGIGPLYAYTVAGRVVVWGLNRAQQVFYTECPTAQVADPAAWSHPVPIAAQVVQLAPYKNRVNGGNTFFAHTGTNTLKKAMQDPASTSWIAQDILLPVATDAKADTCDSYVTRITVCDADNAPLPDTPVRLSSAYRVPVYINNHYYVLDTEPITVNTSVQGALKVVQCIANLQGARITVHPTDGSAAQTINPMDNAAAKAATLNTADSLAQAQVANERGQAQQPLVATDTDPDALASAAASIQSISNAYTHYNGTPPASQKQATGGMAGFRFSPTARVHAFAVNRTTMQLSVIDTVGDTIGDIGEAIVVAAGDLCAWLKDAAEYVIQVIEDTAQNVWNFVATVGGKLYTFVINTVEKAIAALEAIFEALATLIKDVIQFLKFLFSWDDIARTNAVFSNLTRVYLKAGVSKIGGLKDLLNNEVASWIATINDWANLEGSGAGIADQPMDQARTESDYTALYTVPNMFLQDLFTENVANSTEPGPAQEVAGETQSAIEKLMRELAEAVAQESVVLRGASKALYANLVANDQYKTMSVKEILVTLLAIVTDTVLASAAIIIDLVIDLIIAALDAVIEALARPIWIPIVSDFLALFDYEFEFSLLDVVCMVVAFPGTLLYKTVKLEAPFSEDDGYSQQLIDAPDLDTLQQAFGANDIADYAEGYFSYIKLPPVAQQILFMTGHTISGIASGVKGGLVLVEDLAQAPYVPVLSKVKSGFGLIQSAATGITGLFAKPYPLQQPMVSTFSSGVLYVSLASTGLFMVLPTLIKSEAYKSGVAEVGAAVDLVCNLTAIAPLAYHFVELADAPSNLHRSLAITDDTARLTKYLGDMTADLAKMDPEPTSSTVIVVSSFVLAMLNCGLQVCESVVAGAD